jgi:hypothetical protein
MIVEGRDADAMFLSGGVKFEVAVAWWGGGRNGVFMGWRTISGQFFLEYPTHTPYRVVGVLLQCCGDRLGT